MSNNRKDLYGSSEKFQYWEVLAHRAPKMDQ